MMKQIIYKIKTYGMLVFLEYVFLETKYLFRRIFFGSFSQMGEDLVVYRLFPRSHRGFYVDVGANDPVRFNNTCLFYNRGWRGINIEPDLENFSKISKKRHKDINLNIGISDSKSNLCYYRFIPHTLNTFSKEEADNYLSQGFELIETRNIEVDRLENVLDKNLPPGTRIDFISIDTEGFDLSVLSGMNLARFKPRFVCIEAAKHRLLEDRGADTEVFQMLENSGYEKIYTNDINCVYGIIESRTL